MIRFTLSAVLLAFLITVSGADAEAMVPPLFPDSSPGRGLPSARQLPAIHKAGPSEVATIDTFRIIALMIEFPADPGAAISGDGTFGSVQDANEVVFGGGAEPNPYKVDHDAAYFREQLAYLAQYYQVVSYGALQIEAVVPDTIFAAPRTMAYYGNNDSIATRQVRLYEEAVMQADPLVNFPDYDVVMVIHAGAGEETDILGNSPGDLWTTYYTPGDLALALADSAALIPDFPGIATNDVGPLGNDFFVTDGVLLPETETQDQFAQWLLGVAAHMMGRVLGAPSLFDPTPSGLPNSQGIGNFGIMGTGLWNSGGILPPHPCVWTKIYLGWIEPLVVTRDTTIALPLVERADSELKAIKIPITDSEYYLLSNRYPDENGDGLFNFDDVNGDNRLDIFEDSYNGAEFDWSLPAEGSVAGSGILIWHIDEAKIAESGDFLEVNRVNGDAGRKGVDLEEADGIQDLDMRATSLDNFGNQYDAWSTDNMYLESGAVFGPHTEPGTSTNFGARTGITIEVSSAPGSLMTISIDFPERTGAWPVEAREGWQLIGPAMPVHLAGERGVFFACSFVDTVTGKGYGDLISISGLSLAGWPVEFESVPSFAPIYAAVPIGGQFPRLVFPFADGSIIWFESDGSERGRFDPVAGADGLYLSAGPILSGIFPLTLRGDTTLVERITTSGRELVTRLAGRAVSPAVVAEDLIIATDLGEVWSVSYSGTSHWRFDAGGTPHAPSLAHLPGEEQAVIVARGDELHLLDERTGLPMEGSPLHLPAPITGSPALGDIDLDGSPEIVFGTADGKVRVINRTLASSVAWPVLLRSGIVEEPIDPVAGTPGIGDFDDDGLYEIALLTRHGALYLFDQEGEIEPGYPISFAGESDYGVSLGKYATGDTTFLFAGAKSGRLDITLRGVASNPPIEWWGYGNGNPLAARYSPNLAGSPPGGDLIVRAETFVYPNPSRENFSAIHYRVNRPALVTIGVYDVAGMLIEEFGPSDRPAESSEWRWENADRASGLYFMRIEAESEGVSDYLFLPLAVQR